MSVKLTSGIPSVQNSLQADLTTLQSKVDLLADMIFGYALTVNAGNPSAGKIALHLDSEFKSIKKKLRKIEIKRLSGSA